VSGGVDADVGTDGARSPLGKDPLEYIASGHELAMKGQFAAAAACFERALALDPALPMAHNNLGWARQNAGDRAGAMLSYRRALELNGSLCIAQLNLASLLLEMGRAAEARPLWRELLAARPDDRALLDEAITAWLRAGQLSSASALADSYARLCRGSEWFSSRDTRVVIPEQPFPTPKLSTRKLEHDIAQLTYLRRCGKLPSRLAGAISAYGSVLGRIAPMGDNARVILNDPDKALIGHIYNRIVYRPQTPMVQRALSDAWQPESAEEEYLCSPLGLVVIDNFLSEEALQSLRRFCLESTIWFANRYDHGRLGAFFRDGFNCPLLVQISDDLRRAFPRIIGMRYPLLQMWGFKYDNIQPETPAHADFAAINVNFWLTSEDANLGGDTGGMVIYDIEAPADWDFESYNRSGDKISAFLRSRRANTVAIPYRANRAVIFNSDLFHATMPIHFRDGYESRRINVTMLFGNRETSLSRSIT
jgi:TPR repeat